MSEEGGRIIVGAINHTELNHNKFIVPEPGAGPESEWSGLGWTRDQD